MQSELPAFLLYISFKYEKAAYPLFKAYLKSFWLRHPLWFLLIPFHDKAKNKMTIAYGLQWLSMVRPPVVVTLLYLTSTKTALSSGSSKADTDWQSTFKDLHHGINSVLRVRVKELCVLSSSMFLSCPAGVISTGWQRAGHLFLQHFSRDVSAVCAQKTFLDRLTFSCKSYGVDRRSAETLRCKSFAPADSFLRRQWGLMFVWLWRDFVTSFSLSSL